MGIANWVGQKGFQSPWQCLLNDGAVIFSSQNLACHAGVVSHVGIWILEGLKLQAASPLLCRYCREGIYGSLWTSTTVVGLHAWVICLIEFNYIIWVLHLQLRDWFNFIATKHLLIAIKICFYFFQLKVKLFFCLDNDAKPMDRIEPKK